jgi:hypothetical protein
MVEMIGQYSADNIIGVSSLAVGADQMFAELILAVGARFDAIIPCDQYERTFNFEDRNRYAALLKRAASIERLAFPHPSEEAYLAAGQRVVDLSDMLIAVWDGRQAQGKGGTADIVTYANSRGTRVTVVWPKGVER